MADGRRSGLTLVELLLVLLIIGILTGLTVLGVNGLLERASAIGAATELDQVQKALWAYMLTTGTTTVNPEDCISDLGSSDPSLWPQFANRRYPLAGRAYSWTAEGTVTACDSANSAATGSYYANRTLSGQPFLERSDDTIDFDWGYGAPAPGMPTDQFSVRWNLTMRAHEAGIYRFTTRTDDGVRVYVDGHLVIDAWLYMATTVYQGDLQLAAGSHEIVVEYFEGNGNAVAQFSWAYLGSMATGWESSFYSNRSLQGMPVLTRNTQVFNFDYGTTSPGAGVPATNWSATWDGPVNVPDSGRYRFTAQADGGLVLLVDGTPVISAWSGSGLEGNTIYGDIDLIAGSHALNVRYWHASGSAFGILDWAQAPDALDSWAGSYYSNVDLSGTPLLERYDPAVNFDWASASPGGVIPADRFSARWTKSQQFNAGSYTFTAIADDGIRVFVDGHPLIDAWRDQSRRTYTALVSLTAGVHDLKVEYYENTGQAVAIVSWQATP